jgi:hypothetical protein
MRIRAAVLVGLLVLPAVAWGQAYGEPGEHSVIRQTGFGWRNQVSVPAGCGCDVGVRADCYDDPCCFRCGLRPLCFFQRLHRMLDCLLPCHKCGVFGGCLFAGGRCGGCCGEMSCCSPCGTSDLPGFSDPFVDDPLQPVPPKPIADPGTEVRYLPPGRTLPVPVDSGTGVRYLPYARTAPVPAIRHSPAVSRVPQSPYKVVAPPHRQAAHEAPPQATLPHATPPRKLTHGDMHAIQIQPSPAPSKPAVQSVLRRTAAEEPAPPAAEPAPFAVEPKTARPIIRSQSPEERSDDSIPFNPLRGR